MNAGLPKDLIGIIEQYIHFEKCSYCDKKMPWECFQRLSRDGIFCDYECNLKYIHLLKSTGRREELHCFGKYD